MNKEMVKVKCIDKNLERGWIFTKHYVTFEIVDDRFEVVQNTIFTLNIIAEQFYNLFVGDTIEMEMEEQKDGLLTVANYR